MRTKRKVLHSLARRLVEWSGIVGAVGLENDIAQLAGAAGALLSLGWSIWEKVSEARDARKGGALAP